MRRGRRGLRLVAALAAAGLGAAACTGGSATDGAQVVVPDGPCPSNLVIQTDWFPEMEHGGTYQLMGDDGHADAATATYSGPLDPRYVGSHGVATVEIRAGGAAIERSVLDAMDADADITLGYVNTDDVIAARREGRDVVGVMATLELSPQMLMWNPARYSPLEFEDLARTRAKFLYFPGSTYADYLVAQGYLTADQLDDGYDGSPTRWLESDGDVIQQGFATNEVFTYESELDAWKRPVDFFLLHWLGYENYPAMIVARSGDVAAQRDCLAALVPVMQRAWADFLVDPGPTSRKVVDILDTYDTFFKVSEALNERAIEIFKQYEIASNGPDATLGNFDEARVGRLLGIVGDVYAKRNDPLPAGLQPSDIVTNEFVDPAIGLPDGWNQLEAG